MAAQWMKNFQNPEMNHSSIGRRLGDLSELPPDLLSQLKLDSAEVGVECSAVFSDDRRYRYELWRRWAPGAYAMFIGLNPSTADETTDDPTIRRCIGFAKSWGFSALCMTNLFAFRATDPKLMKVEPFPIGGVDNDLALVSLAEAAGIVIAAWGVDGNHRERDAVVRSLIPNLQCLGTTKGGHPRHPLYLKKDVTPIPFP